MGWSLIGRGLAEQQVRNRDIVEDTYIVTTQHADDLAAAVKLDEETLVEVLCARQPGALVAFSAKCVFWLGCSRGYIPS